MPNYFQYLSILEQFIDFRNLLIVVCGRDGYTAAAVTFYVLLWYIGLITCDYLR